MKELKDFPQVTRPLPRPLAWIREPQDEAIFANFNLFEFVHCPE